MKEKENVRGEKVLEMAREMRKCNESDVWERFKLEKMIMTFKSNKKNNIQEMVVYDKGNC